jgi:chaperonin GroEL
MNSDLTTTRTVRDAIDKSNLTQGGSVMKIRPLHDRILIERVEEEAKSKGGIIIPDTAKEKPMQGKVVAVGKGKSRNFGFNAETEKYEDLIVAGVIDPTKVARLALQNAASVAALLLTTDVVVIEKPKKEKEHLPSPEAVGDMY